MKKVIFFLVAAGFLTACDPTQSEKDYVPVALTADEVNGAITIVQTDVDGNVASDGNYFTFTTNPATMVSIFNKDADGNENQLASGYSGSFSIKPKRGSDPNVTYYVRTVNSDNSEVVIEKQTTVFVKQDLDPEIRLLASDAYGSKTWKWDPSISSGEVWGNMGYQPGTGASVGLEGNGKWWGVTLDEEGELSEFLNQLKHTPDGKAHGDESINAYMIIDEDGYITCYDNEGNEIRKDKYEVEGYDPNAEWRLGLLKTKSILWPYEINSGGNIPGQYEIVYLTTDKLCLVYPDGGSQGSWGEASFWHFCSNTDLEGMACGGYDVSSSKSWTWDQSIGSGEVWGNMGYMPGSGASVGLEGNGKWWGCLNEEDFSGQKQHSNDGNLHGDESMDAYFTLTGEGKIFRYAGDGTLLNSGTYSIDVVEGDDSKVGILNTTAGTILWPFEINSGGNMPTWFDLVYLSGSKMCLVYPDGGSQGSWGEASFWHFKAKE